MNIARTGALAILACFAAVPGAVAATATGRITYIAPDLHQLMLNNNDLYQVAPQLDLSQVSVADRVRINWNRQGGEDVITSLSKAPLTPGAAG